MVRKYRRSGYSSFADDEGSRDLRVFLSSLVIGVCLGAFAVYFFVARPHGHELASLRAQVRVLAEREQSCTVRTTNTGNQREDLESRLSACLADLSRLRRATQDNAQAVSNGAPRPPLPRVPPGRQPSAPVSPADVMPPEPPAESNIDQPQEPVPPPAPFVRPANWPPLPKAPPAGLRGVLRDSTPESEPAPAEATPALPAPAIVQEQATSSSPLVWPKNFPPRPRNHPPRPAGSAPTVETTPLDPSPTATGPAGPLGTAQSVVLNVGEEEDVGGYKLRLIAVSRRTTGQYCIVGGNGMVGQRLASGSSKRVNWNGHSVTLQATVRDADTCQVALRPG